MKNGNLDILLPLFRQGDEAAFRALFEQFFKSSCAFVGRFVDSAATVKDIVQETFINIWDKRTVFNDGVHFKAYLYRSLRNNTLLFLQRSHPGEQIDPRLGDEGYDILGDMIVEEVHREIIGAVGKLPEQRRRIIELSMGGLSHEEIAEKMDISVNTIKTQKRKAYEFLRTELKGLFAVFLLLVNHF